MAEAIGVDPCIKRRDRWTWLREGGAETRDTCTMAGRAPRGVMLLGAIYSIPASPKKVKYSWSKRPAKAENVGQYEICQGCLPEAAM